MTDEQLDKLAKIVPLYETCAKMGGTKGFDKISQAVNKLLHDWIEDYEESQNEEAAMKEPQAPMTEDTRASDTRLSPKAIPAGEVGRVGSGGNVDRRM